MPNFPSTALVIINQRARRGAEEELSACLSRLTDGGIRLIKFQSHSARHTNDLIAMHRQRVDLVILAGGDGTVSSAAEALYRYKLPFAILPLGTANDLARSLELPINPAEACEAILANQRNKIDLAVVNGRYFFNVAHLGLGVNITHQLTPETKKHFGVFSYLKALLRTIERRRVFRALLVVDGKIIRLRSIHIAIGNGRYYGGGNIVSEEAALDNGLLCLYSIKPQSFWGLLTLAPLLREGKQHLTKRTVCLSGHRIEIKTRRKMEIHADGEPATFTPAVFEVLPGALEVISPGVESSKKDKEKGEKESKKEQQKEFATPL